jgi:hypothetical protein
MKSAQQIIEEFVQDLGKNPNVHAKVSVIIRELLAERKLNASNLKAKLDEMIEEVNK